MTFAQLKQRLASGSAHFSARDYPPPVHRTFAGLDVAIENPAGSVRSGVGRDGKPWAFRLKNHYGYLRRGLGADNEGLDIFLGPDESAPDVHIIHQNDPHTGRYDECKAVAGVRSVDEAKRLYLSNYDDKGPRMYRSCTVIPLATFKTMLTKGKPGGVHWSRKNKRAHETAAMFAAQPHMTLAQLFTRLRYGESLCFDEQGELWVTIGGGEEQRGKKTVKHAGGTPVQIKGDGTITKGPPELKHKKISELPGTKSPPAATPLFEPHAEVAKPPAKAENPPLEPIHAKPEIQEPVAAPRPGGLEDQRADTGRIEPDAGRRAELGGTDSGSTGRPASKPTEERIVTARPELTKPADPALVPEGLRQFLAPHQVQGAAKAIAAMDQHGGFLLSDGTGAGKTRTQLAVAKTYADRDKKVLIVTKSEVVKPDWKTGEMTGSFKADSETMGIPIKLTRGEEPLKAGEIAVTTYNRLSEAKQHVDKDTVLIWDESHSLKNSQSARAKHGYEVNKVAHAVMYATATPADKPLHIAHLFRAKVFGDRRWEDTYRELGMEQKAIRTPQGTINKWEYSKSVRPAERYRRFAGLFDRMTEDGLMLKRELDFTGLNINVDRISLPPEAHQSMADIEEAITEESEANEGLTRALVLMQQRRQQEPYKIPSVVERAKKELAEGRHVIIFASRVNKSEVSVGEDDDKEVIAESEGTAKLLKDALEKEGITNVLELHGGVTPAKRIKAMNDFQAGKGKVIVATIEAGGTGINLDDTAGDKPRSMIVMTAPFSAVENVQALGRAWRLTTKSDPRFFYVFGDTDVDDWNSQLISKKMKTLGAAVAGESNKMNLPSRESEAALGGLENAELTGPAERYQWPALIRPSPIVRVKGDTFPHKEKLKAMGFRWNPDQKVWYRNREGFDPDRLPRGLSHYSAEMHGREVVCLDMLRTLLNQMGSQFSSDNDYFANIGSKTHRAFPTLGEAQEFLNKTHKGHGRILSLDGKVLHQCRCGGGETVCVDPTCERRRAAIFACGNSTFTAFTALDDASRTRIESFMREAATFAADSLGFDSGESGHWLSFKSDEDAEDVWRTIGAKDHHGGTPVLIKKATGEIEAGPKKFIHKNVEALPSTHKPIRSMEALRQRLERGVVGQKPGMVGLQKKPGQPVPVDKELAAFAPLGNVTLPTHEGVLDKHLEDAYRRAAAKQGFDLGAFKVDPETNLASADVSKAGRGLPQPSPKAPPASQTGHAQSAPATSAEKHPLYDRATGATIPTEAEQAANLAQPAGQAAPAGVMTGAAAPAGPEQPAPMPQQAQTPPVTGTMPEFPHQVTASDYLNAYKRHREANGLPVIASSAIADHEKHVAEALKTGQNVPAEVLKDYAHLQPPHEHQKAALEQPPVAPQFDPKHTAEMFPAKPTAEEANPEPAKEPQAKSHQAAEAEAGHELPPTPQHVTQQAHVNADAGVQATRQHYEDVKKKTPKGLLPSHPNHQEFTKAAEKASAAENRARAEHEQAVKDAIASGEIQNHPSYPNLGTPPSPVESLKQKIAEKKAASPIAAIKQQMAVQRESDPAIGKKIRARVNELTKSGMSMSDAILQALGIGKTPTEKMTPKQLHDRIEYLQNRGGLNAAQSRELAELRTQYEKVGQQTMRPVPTTGREQPIAPAVDYKAKVAAVNSLKDEYRKVHAELNKLPPFSKTAEAKKLTQEGDRIRRELQKHGLQWHEIRNLDLETQREPQGISRAPTIAPNEPTGDINNPAAAGEWTEVDPRTGKHTPEGLQRAQASVEAGHQAKIQASVDNAINIAKKRFYGKPTAEQVEQVARDQYFNDDAARKAFGDYWGFGAGVRKKFEQDKAAGAASEARAGRLPYRMPQGI